ncbi:uncharacterized protein LOC118198300 [Stegodyphus dumicola]|uniref:uncharacterized protein LOC118198300 n=1 Tax=Stegodyphus dumicola TaxID=202533 RepID=UPI0015AA57EC|nr:uncharacterized protein LOC118198300 [Stegodyphus dumicola]
MQQLMREQKIDNVLIAGDFNCHSTTKGYATTEPKGRTLEDFISSNNLILHNQQDAPPTFDRVHSRGWPDLTVSTLQMAQLVQDWMVVEGVSLSDHNYIRFTIARATETTIIRRYNLPGRKVRSFVTAIKSRLAPFSNRIEQATTREELHVLTSELMSTIRTTCDDILPVRTIRRVTTLNWWNSQLRAQQQKCRALRRRLKTGKLFKQASFHLLPIPNTNEHLTEATLTEVLNTVFTKDDPTDDTTTQATMRNQTLAIDAMNDALFTNQDILHVLRQLPQKKAPGPDGINYRIVKIAIRSHVNLFRASTSTSSVPFSANFFPLAHSPGASKLAQQ